MSGQIFISYRRGDDSAWARLVYDRLHARFPGNKVFIDVDSIDPGIDFAKAIEKSVGSCDVLIAVIGRQWLTSSGGRRRRLDNPDDYVRLEIGTALKRGIRVIPVLVEGALMPRPGELPGDLKALTRRNAFNVSHHRFQADAEQLLDAVERALANARAEGQRPYEDQERIAAEQRGEPLRDIDADPRAPPSKPTPPKEGTANLKRPWWLLVVIGIGVAVCLLGFGLFRATRPPWSVSIGGSSSPTPAPHATASNSQSPAALVSRASPSPAPSSEEGLVAPVSPVPAPAAAPSNSPALPMRRGSLLIRESPLLTKPGVSLLATPTPAPSNSPSPTPSGADQFAEAKRYLNAKDYAKALPLLQEAADAGSAAAMYNLGWLYEYGLGVAQDYDQARRWYQKAAEAGNADAMYGLGYMYEYGKGLTQDYAQARRWYQEAADAGNTEAKQALAQLPNASVTPSPTISAASSEPQDDAKTQAYDSYLKAAKAGNAEAMCRLGWVYQNGWGVGQDYAKARDWYQRAAKARNAEAIYRLGQIYENGWGVDPDYAKARGWYQKAVDAGGDLANDAEQALSRLRSQVKD
jgi:TPR repeat protein